jgi:hypothetical protein
MATIIHLEKCLSYRYVGTCSHLDRWQSVGRAKVFPARLVREPGKDIADCGTYVLTAKIPAGQDPLASREALRDHFTSEGCHHDYDCCGCRSTWAEVRRIAGRTFSVKLHVSRNY